MKSVKNIIRQRSDENTYRCVTVDDRKTWKSFSYREFVDDKEVKTQQFTELWDAINYFNNEVEKFMSPWRELARSHQ